MQDGQKLGIIQAEGDLMKLSTRGIYGLEALVFLAIQPKDSYVSLKTIAQNRNVSLKYLEQIFSKLKESGILHSTRGKHGGYQFAKHPATITAYDIIEILELEWSIPSCHDDPKQNITHTVFLNLKEEIMSVLSYYSLEDLAITYQQKHYKDFMI